MSDDDVQVSATEQMLQLKAQRIVQEPQRVPENAQQLANLEPQRVTQWPWGIS